MKGESTDHYTKEACKNVKKYSILGARESCPRSPDAGCHHEFLLAASDRHGHTSGMCTHARTIRSRIRPTTYRQSLSDWKTRSIRNGRQHAPGRVGSNLRNLMLREPKWVWLKKGRGTIKKPAHGHGSRSKRRHGTEGSASWQKVKQDKTRQGLSGCSSPEVWLDMSAKVKTRQTLARSGPLEWPSLSWRDYNERSVSLLLEWKVMIIVLLMDDGFDFP